MHKDQCKDGNIDRHISDNVSPAVSPSQRSMSGDDGSNLQPVVNDR